ncbi:hypothetical protein ACFQZS_15215 [Mucilaginibacter calamicampi]|uniref:Uncharacterized protein n=1 Tax=Mucilaginibacter calamicampi TaxID=1302352 RepID=A0ABW2Z0D0_9SPHI
MKTTEKDTRQPVKKSEGNKTAAKELKTDFPMSEKDEVKQAERNTQKQQNKDR